MAIMISVVCDVCGDTGWSRAVVQVHPGPVYDAAVKALKEPMHGRLWTQVNGQDCCSMRCRGNAWMPPDAIKCFLHGLQKVVELEGGKVCCLCYREALEEAQEHYKGQDVQPTVIISRARTMVGQSRAKVPEEWLQLSEGAERRSLAVLADQIPCKHCGQRADWAGKEKMIHRCPGPNEIKTFTPTQWLEENGPGPGEQG